MHHYSLLDLSPIPEGKTTADALANTVELARAAERLGYHRYWLAEHHNMPGIASAATAVVIGHVAGATRNHPCRGRRHHAPNHSPLVIAEQFGTLETLYPGPDRPRPRTRPGHGHGNGPRPCAGTWYRKTRFRRTWSISCTTSTTHRRHAGTGHSRNRHACPGLDPRLEPLRRAAGCISRPSLCLRVAFRSGHAGGCHRHLSRHVPTIEDTSHAPTS
jgi:hypothetical protein